LQNDTESKDNTYIQHANHVNDNLSIRKASEDYWKSFIHYQAQGTERCKENFMVDVGQQIEVNRSHLKIPIREIGQALTKQFYEELTKYQSQ
jgi:hypothetical protein